MNTPRNVRQASLPIWRDANRLLIEIEQAVRRFGKTPSPPRYHKYALGTDLRQQAMTVCRCIVRCAACSAAILSWAQCGVGAAAAAKAAAASNSTPESNP